MDETINKLIEKARYVVDGKVMYKAEVITKINDLGVYLQFTDEGVRYFLNP